MYHFSFCTQLICVDKLFSWEIKKNIAEVLIFCPWDLDWASDL